MFTYEPILDTLELQKDKDTDYALNWKSKGVFNSKFRSLFTAFLYIIQLSGYRNGTNFDKDALVVKQNNYFTKIINVHIVYDQTNTTNNFTF